ncbi:MAG: hemolysin family protein [Pseudomonadota bacterium]
MSSTSDPSSTAAQRAQVDLDAEPPRPGFFARLFGPRPQETAILAENVPARRATASVGLLNLRRMKVDEVSIPRAEITAVACDISLADLVQVFRESGKTRLPVYDETLDSPLGMVHLKDVAMAHGFNGAAPDFDVRETLRPLLFAPPSMPIGVLLTKMQADRTHMALVIDEYGGVDGLVTIEDLIEQVIGEIEDEHDVEEDQPWTREASGAYLALARAPLDEFEAETGLHLSDVTDDEEVDTLGGLVFILAGRVPARGEIVPHPSGAQIEVVDADPRRVKRLRVRWPKAAE